MTASRTILGWNQFIVMLEYTRALKNREKQMMIIERLSAINAIYARMHVFVPYNIAIYKIEININIDGLQT